jgi:alanyl-tRNA synthetase
VEFTGYDQTVTDATVRGIIHGGEVVQRVGPGEEIELVLDRTPLYAESGGQQADHGFIRLSNGALLEVSDVQRPITGLVVHQARVVEGEVATGESAEAVVDVARRRSISRAHTATHMVHQALRDELGETATQAGSENSPGRLRFDFKATQAVPAEAMAEIEARINGVLLDDLPVTADVMALDAARRMGAMALFGEKYGERVRVVSIGDWSRELCVGTHTPRVGQIGVVKLLGEASIGSGVRRVEALVGADAYGHLAREAAIVSQLTHTLNVRQDELPDRIASLLTKLKDAEREIAAVKQGQVLGAAAGLVASARDIGGVTFVSHDAGGGVRAEDLRALVLDVRTRLGSDRPVVVSMAAVAGDRPIAIVATNERARSEGIKAGAYVRIAAQVLGGGGGGKDDIAQGGGSDPSKVSDALGAVENALRTRGA